MKCPNCNSSVPNSWNICRCGYNLKAGESVTKPIYKRNAEVVKSKEEKKQEIRNDIREINNTIKNKPKPRIKKPISEITEVIDTDSLVATQKAEMLKASEAIRRRNIDGDATQILNVSETPIEMTNPNLEKEVHQNSQVSEDIIDGSISSRDNISGGDGSTKRINFFGKGTTLLGIFIVNILLSIITLGVYIFWGKIRTLRYLYSQSELEGDRFEFHGTGLELLFGFLIAILALLLLVGGSGFLIAYTLPKIIALIIGSIGLYIVIILLFPLAILLTIKYRFSRTSWRGVRFSFRGNTKEFFKIYIVGFFLTSITLGFYYYMFHYRTREYLINNIYFGDTRFEFDGNSNDLYSGYVKLWLITILISGTSQAFIEFLPAIKLFGGVEVGYLVYIVLLIIIGIYWLKFFAKRHNHYWNHTKFVNARFNLNIDEREFIKLQIVNYILIIFTLGIAYPYVQIRNIKFLLDRLSLQGDLDLIAIQQDARTPSALGEEVATFLDIDLVGMNLGI